MTRWRAFVVVLALVPATARAEDTLKLPTHAERKAADLASWGTLLTNIAFDTKASWDCADRAHCFEFQALRLGTTYAAVLGAKALVHRLRPCAPECGIDNPRASFFSGHTAGAFQAVSGPRLAVTLPLAITTGGLRIAAGKHWPTDTLVGAGVGLLASRIR